MYDGCSIGVFQYNVEESSNVAKKHHAIIHVTRYMKTRFNHASLKFQCNEFNTIPTGLIVHPYKSLDSSHEVYLAASNVSASCSCEIWCNISDDMCLEHNNKFYW